jgi:hypothetical protein
MLCVKPRYDRAPEGGANGDHDQRSKVVNTRLHDQMCTVNPQLRDVLRLERTTTCDMSGSRHRHVGELTDLER